MYSSLRNPHPVDVSDVFPIQNDSQEYRVHSQVTERRGEESELTRVIMAGFSQLQTRVSDGLFSIEFNNIKF